MHATNTAAATVTAPKALDNGYLIGLGTLVERMLILGDIDKLMASDEIGLIAQPA